MHLLIILIRWLMGVFGVDRLIAAVISFNLSSGVRTIGLRLLSNGAYSSGVGVMKVALMLADLHSFFGWRPALAVISPHCRSKSHVISYHSENVVADAAPRSSYFSQSLPHIWG